MTQQAQTTGRAIRTQYDTSCKETGATILKGSLCIWYPATNQTYHIDSPQGIEFKGGEKK